MNKNLLTLGLATSCVLMSAVSAQAFTFTTNTTGNGPDGNIRLDSVEFDGIEVDNFVFVNSADIETLPFFNDAYSGGNSGAASSDQTSGSSNGTIEEAPTNADIVTSLGNNSLSSIVDTEDNGSFNMKLTFDGAFNKLFFWERGHNSDLEVVLEGIAEPIKLLRTQFDQGITDYTLRTNEIAPNVQQVGSYGINLLDYGISKYTGSVILRSEAKFDGPDFKVVGAQVPEPATMLGLGLVAGAGFLASRRKQAEA
jgi:hypothetical protein